MTGPPTLHPSARRYHERTPPSPGLLSSAGGCVSSILLPLVARQTRVWPVEPCLSDIHGAFSHPLTSPYLAFPDLPDASYGTATALVSHVSSAMTTPLQRRSPRACRPRLDRPDVRDAPLIVLAQEQHSLVFDDRCPDGDSRPTTSGRLRVRGSSARCQ